MKNAWLLGPGKEHNTTMSHCKSTSKSKRPNSIFIWKNFCMPILCTLQDSDDPEHSVLTGGNHGSSQSRISHKALDRLTCHGQHSAEGASFAGPEESKSESESAWEEPKKKDAKLEAFPPAV